MCMNVLCVTTCHEMKKAQCFTRYLPSFQLCTFLISPLLKKKALLMYLHKIYMDGAGYINKKNKGTASTNLFYSGFTTCGNLKEIKMP